MTAYTARLGQFQVTDRPGLGTIEGVQLLQDGAPVALLWSTLDTLFFGAEKDRELRATLGIVRRIIGRHDNYSAIVDAWCDCSREFHRFHKTGV